MDKNIASLSVPLGQLKEEVLVSVWLYIDWGSQVCAYRIGLMRIDINSNLHKVFYLDLWSVAQITFTRALECLK